MRWQGQGSPLRSPGLSAYEVAADALSLSPLLQPILTPAAMDSPAGPTCFAGLGAPDYENATAASLSLAARLFVPQLEEEGYDVTLREYDGGHGVPREVVREAYQWFVAGGTRP